MYTEYTIGLKSVNGYVLILTCKADALATANTYAKSQANQMMLETNIEWQHYFTSHSGD